MQYNNDTELTLYTSKDKILKVQEQDLEEIRIHLIKACRLFNACKRIDHYLSLANYCTCPRSKYLFGGDIFTQDMYIDNILIEIYKLTERKNKKNEVFGIRDLRNLSNTFINKYNITPENCIILTKNEGTVVQQQFKYCDMTSKGDNTWDTPYDLVKKQNKRLDHIEKLISKLRATRSQIQAHSDFTRLMKDRNSISVNELVHKIQTQEYLRGDIAGTDIDSINNYWHQVYEAYDNIRRAIQYFIFIMLSVYSRQSVKDEHELIRVRALNDEDIDKLLNRIYY